jgi:hypothetical protein
MTDNAQHASRNPKKEPKFCKCRVCHEYFYGDTIEDARQQCLMHGKENHPDWGETVCYCPD